jgi:methylmalonyl-CoA mutase
VEEAVLAEFDRIRPAGRGFGGHGTGYQRSKIQDESIYYETMKTTPAICR